MLIYLPSVTPYEGHATYYKEVRHILKLEPAYMCSVRNSSQCVHPMNLTQILLLGNWDVKIVNWFKWVNENICLTLDIDHYKTIGVKLRIATGMLNNIESLTDEEKIQIHSNLTSNVWNEYELIQTSLLPF